MKYILDKYVSPCKLMTLRFSSLQLVARGQWAGIIFFGSRLALKKLVSGIVDLVNQSKERNCEDMCVLTMMCIVKMAGCVVLPMFFAILQASAETVCTE
jgi:hypothetical protein